MEQNPYQSPKSVAEVEKRPKKSPNRFFHAAVCGFLGFMGPFILLLGLFRSSLTPLGPPYTALPVLLIPVSVGVAMATWAWYYPESKWVLPVAILLVVTGFAIPILIGVLVFGVH